MESFSTMIVFVSGLAFISILLITGILLVSIEAAKMVYLGIARVSREIEAAKLGIVDLQDEQERISRQN